jgi:RNA polymerase sigma-70 factor (ECF subfamily)
VVRALPVPVHGAVEIATFIAGLGADRLGLTLRPSAVNGSPAVLVFERGRVTTVMALGIRDGRIATLDAIRNPHKFHGLRSLIAGDE